MHKINLYMTLCFILGGRNCRRKIIEIMSFHVLLVRLLNARSKVGFSHAVWGLKSHYRSILHLGARVVISALTMGSHNDIRVFMRCHRR